MALVILISTPRFFTAGTLSTILALASIVGVLAIGQAFVLIGGGFDLSQGAMVALTAAAAAFLAAPAPAGLGLGAMWAGPAAVLIGAGLGAFNGLSVAFVGTNPFVTTLSTQLVYRGAAFLLLAGQPISGVTAFAGLSRGPEIGGTLVPWRGFVFLGLTLLAAMVLRFTVYGRHLYAVGGNPEAARLAGLRTRWLKLTTFALSGAGAGLAALLLLSWVRVAKPTTGIGLELDSIAAGVVGGISLQGGQGRILGAAAGCLLLQALGTWITIRGFQDEYRSLLTGGVILAFAAIDAWSRRRGRGGRAA